MSQEIDKVKGSARMVEQKMVELSSAINEFKKAVEETESDEIELVDIRVRLSEIQYPLFQPADTLTKALELFQ